MKLDGLHLEDYVVKVMGKGWKGRLVPIGRDMRDTCPGGM